MPVSPSIESAIREQLQRAGRLSAQQALTFQPVAQNPERRDSTSVQRQVVAGGKTPIAFLITGPDLSELQRRTELFSTTYPALACPVLAHGTTPNGAYLLTEYFDGTSAGDALTAREIGLEQVLAALRVIADQYSNATRSSTPAAAREELQGLFARVLAIKYWTALDREFFSSVVFPFVEQHLVSSAPRCRVSNGDFTLTNIMVNRHGDVRVIDYEGASLTHFFAEDWLRLTYWKAPDVVRRFALRQITGNPAISLYLSLKQLVFEDEAIIPSRGRLDIQHWGVEIRKSIELHSPEIQQSLIWPAPSPETSRRFLRLAGNATRNLSRALELCKFAQFEHEQTREDTHTLLHHLNSSQVSLYQREIKILQMQRSFSWRATGWLRALRRALIDPYFGKPAAPVLPAPTALSLPTHAFPFSPSDFSLAPCKALYFEIESPVTWQAKPSDINKITGWIVTDQPITLRQIRARVGGRTYDGSYGLERPEITEKFLPRAYSGFEINVVLEESDTYIDLEVADSSGEWFLFLAQPLSSSKDQQIALPQPRFDTTQSHYARWVEQHDTITSEQCEALIREVARFQEHPLISIVMPVYNAPERWLSRAIESVRAQVYPRWELCIADDASSAPHIRALLEKAAREDPRIKVVFRPQNGHISAASNSALELATGEFVTFLDHDDEIERHALYCFAKVLYQHPDAEVVYSDEDKIDEAGNRFTPHFKPDWNPDLLNSQNYFCHLVAYRTATVRAVGGFCIGVEGSQDWDLAFRITERVKPEQIHHVHRVLYHWRAISGSTASQPTAKDYTTTAARKALEEHFKRLNQNVTLDLVRGGHWHVIYPRPEPSPLVTLIIPTRNRRELLVTCVESLLAQTGYPNFEILIADNDSDDPELFSFYEKMKATGRVSVLPCPGSFNFSAIINRAVRQAHGTVIGLLNNDLETMHPEWLDEMVSHAVRPELGIVGAKLYYPDLSIQHAGVITGLGGIAGHAFKKFARNDPGNAQYRPHLVHNVTAVTAACIVLRKSVFEEADGFNETELKVAFNDVDFCLRVQSLGYRNLFTPFAELIHHESASRGLEDTPEKIVRFQGELKYMQQRWGERLLNDPAYNLNLTLDREDFSYAFPPRIPN